MVRRLVIGHRCEPIALALLWRLWVGLADIGVLGSTRHVAHGIAVEHADILIRRVAKIGCRRVFVDFSGGVENRQRQIALALAAF